MKCEKEYCIYNKNKSCILDSIRLDEFGMCEESIIIEIEKDFLDIIKENQLDQINRYNF